MTIKKYLQEIHKENKDWIKALDFVKDQVVCYEKQLGEVTSKNTKTAVLARAEHFQNQFIIHCEVIDELRHDINLEEKKIVENVKANNIATDHIKVTENESLVERMERFDKIWSELKNEYLNYLVEVM